MAKKKGTSDGLSFKLPLAMKTGKYQTGYKSALRLLKTSQTKFIVISANFPSVKRKLLEYYAVLCANVPITVYKGTNNELAKMCDISHRLGVISILDAGEADLTSIVA